MSTDSYRKCAKCGAKPTQDGIVSFHRFPKPGKTNVERARAWAKFCWPEQDWSSVEALTQLFKSNKVLCKRHFQDHCFTDSDKKTLGRFTVPTVISDAVKIMEPLQNEQEIQGRHTVTPNIETITVCEAGSSTQIDSNDSLPQPSNSSIKTKKKGILKSFDVKKIKDLTPREIKLYMLCRKSIKEISRLQKQLKHKKKTDQIEKLFQNENVIKLLDMNLSKSFIILLQSQLQNCKKPKKGRRYSLEQKIMSLTLYKKSPSCYRLLRRMMALPCQTTLKKLLNRIPLKPGINHHIFDSLKKMAEKNIDEENLCILSFDEMAIRKHLYYNEKLDLIEGFQDHGNHGRTQQIASNALVFMLSGVRKNWKQPIAFYFSGKSVTGDRLSVIIKEILHECWNTGLSVVATVCDLSRVNIKALDNLGSTKDQPYIIHEGHEVVNILDPPHLLKCTRNLFMNHNIECTTNVQVDGQAVRGVAKWSHVQQFYDLDKNNPNFVFAPALTEQHLKPNSKQKMRVCLAAQVFSHSVASGLLGKIGNNELPAEAQATATLLDNFDQLFDALNANTPDLRRGKKTSTNITNNSVHLDFFFKMRKFISELNFIGSNSPPPSQMGWIRTINAVERLWKNLQNLGLNSLSTRRLNQDPLENCFGCIRYHCGSNNNPTIEQFTAGIKTAILNNLRYTSSKQNCEEDTSILNNNLKNFLLSTELPAVDICDSETNIDVEPLITDATEAIEQASAEAQACAYVCGFIYKKLKSECNNCKQIFLNETTSHEPIHLFTTFKEYDTMHNSLKYVNNNFVHCVEVCASIVNTILNKEAWKINIKKNILSALLQVDFDFLRHCPGHYENNKKHIMMSTFYICSKRHLVLKNREFGEEESAKSLQRKMTIIKNK